jgi:hypothetical protein
VPFSCREEERYFVITMSGNLTMADLGGLAALAAEIDRGASAAKHRIGDMTGVTSVAFRFDEVASMTEGRRASVLPQPVRTALVASGGVGLGFARMYETLLRHPQIRVRVFADVAGAVAWLEEP